MSGGWSPESARLAQEWYQAVSELWETRMRQAWLRRYRLLCARLGVRECPL